MQAILECEIEGLAHFGVGFGEVSVAVESDICKHLTLGFDRTQIGQYTQG